jgi:hypothetical protein
MACCCLDGAHLAQYIEPAALCGEINGFRIAQIVSIQKIFAHENDQNKIYIYIFRVPQPIAYWVRKNETNLVAMSPTRNGPRMVSRQMVLRWSTCWFYRFHCLKARVVCQPNTHPFIASTP